MSAIRSVNRRRSVREGLSPTFKLEANIGEDVERRTGDMPDPAGKVVDLDDSPAVIHRRGCQKLAHAKKGGICASSTNIDVGDPGIVLLRVLGRTCAPAGDHRFEMRARDGHDELARHTTQSLQDFVRVSFLGRLTGDDHGPGFDLTGFDPGGIVLAADPFGQARDVDCFPVGKRGKYDRGLVQNALIRDTDARDLAWTSCIRQDQARKDQLGCGRSNINSDRKHSA